MIITRLTGGLGNQMFQYAAGLALAEHLRTVLKLDVSWFSNDPAYEAHNRYALSCLNVTEQFATAEEVDRVRGHGFTRIEKISARLAKALSFDRYASQFSQPSNVHYEPGGGFYPEFFDQPDHTYLHGIWQSPRFFESIANLLRLHFSFRYPPQPRVAEAAAMIQTDGPSAAVHFRRGDYVRNPSFNKQIGVVSLDYYDRALALLREQAPDVKLYIFSDDIDAIEREFKPPVPHVFMRVTQPWHSYDKIRLMSLCDHAIISNSTFAWWSAWLNPNPSRLVFAPTPWFSGSEYSNADILPQSWNALALQ